MSDLKPRIRLYWSKKENDLMATWDNGATSATARYLSCAVFTKEVLEELDRRGYDVSTLRFQIRRK